MPKGFKTSVVPSRYQPLFDFLASYESNAVTLTYREIDAILGAPLPPSAILVTSWWTAAQHGQVQAWRALGWRARASATHRRVSFTRDVEQEGRMASKYDRLGQHLAAVGAATIILTFAEIQAVVGPLPSAARRSAQWWGATINGRYHNAHAFAWHRAGYVADRPDFAAETVTFRRMVP